MNNIEKIAREEFQKVRDASMATGLFVGLNTIKDIIDDKKINDSEKIEKINNFIKQTLPKVKTVPSK